MERMKLMRWACCLTFFALLSGCVSKKSTQRTYLEGVQRGAAAVQATAPAVTVLGDVRQNVIAWSEGLTLAQAITAAQHVRRVQPRAIILRRGNEAIRIAPEYLFQGGEDPALLPGDVIELVR